MNEDVYKASNANVHYHDMFLQEWTRTQLIFGMTQFDTIPYKLSTVTMKIIQWNLSVTTS